MNRITIILLGALATLLLSGATLVVAPYFQFRDTPPPKELRPYSPLELRGRALYVSNGCVYCHSQQPRDPSMGPDGQRGWGRPSTPADYYFDKPHVLGTMRTGPDLLNIGARQPSDDWHLAHLYQPRAVVAGSTMPAYPFMFKLQEAARAGDKVVTLPPEYRPKDRLVIAGNDAIALTAYMKALNRTYPAVGPAGDAGDKR
jgi:cytochrome c oxidase cbb3-type subunit 2